MVDDPYLTFSSNLMNRFIQAQQIKLQRDIEDRREKRFEDQMRLNQQRLGMLGPVYKAQAQYYKTRNTPTGVYPSSAYQILPGKTEDAEEAGYYRVNKVTGEMNPLGLEPSYSRSLLDELLMQRMQERETAGLTSSGTGAAESTPTKGGTPNIFTRINNAMKSGSLPNTGSLFGMPQATEKPSVFNEKIITRGGKQWRIIGYDDDGVPRVEPIE